MASATSIPLDPPKPRVLSTWRHGGIAAVLLGTALLADIGVFAAYVSLTGVTIPGNDPAAYPEAFARLLVNGASSHFWIWYMGLGAVAVFAFNMVQSLADHLGSAGSRLPTRPLGYAALVIYLVIALASATIERQAGSPVLTQSELVTAIPVLFGVVIPVLLGSFNLLAAAWILATSWDGWRMAALPKWLSVLGGVTSLVLLAGVTGAPGVEVLAGPWLIAAGIWMLTRSGGARPSEGRGGVSLSAIRSGR